MDIVSNSAGKNDVIMSDEIEKSFRGLRGYMFEHVYTNEIAKGQEKKAGNMVIELFEHYMKHFDELFSSIALYIKNNDIFKS